MSGTGQQVWECIVSEPDDDGNTVWRCTTVSTGRSRYVVREATP